MKNRSNEAVSVTQPASDAAPFFAKLAGTHHASSEGISSPMPHSIDFHAAMVAPDDKYRMLGPGESIRFEWVANYPGVFTYHCGTPPVLHHMAMGQYGIVVVSPRHGYPTDSRIARSYVVVQSEFYLNHREHAERQPLRSRSRRRRPQDALAGRLQRPRKRAEGPPADGECR